MMAASAGHVGALRALLAGGADPSLSTETMNVLERVAIDRAAQQRYRQAVTEIRAASEGGTVATIRSRERSMPHHMRDDRAPVDRSRVHHR